MRQWPTDTQSICYGQSQKSKPRDHQVRWSISLIKATPAKYLGQVFATTESDAIKEFNVAENLRIGLWRGRRTTRDQPSLSPMISAVAIPLSSGKEDWVPLCSVLRCFWPC